MRGWRHLLVCLEIFSTVKGYDYILGIIYDYIPRLSSGGITLRSIKKLDTQDLVLKGPTFAQKFVEELEVTLKINSTTCFSPRGSGGKNLLVVVIVVVRAAVERRFSESCHKLRRNLL